MRRWRGRQGHRGGRKQDICLDEVDPLLGEHSIQEDSAAGRAHFEQRA